MDTSDRIVEAALALAEQHGWHDVRLYQVADRLGVPLAEVQARFLDLDAVANAWFDRALAHTVALPDVALADLPPPARLHLVICRWFRALDPHREVARQILTAKLYPGHPHHLVPLVFDLSRLVHWFLDAARIASTGRRRQLAEIGLSAIFLATLGVWLRRGDAAMAAALEARLTRADRWLGRRGRGRRTRNDSASE